MDTDDLSTETYNAVILTSEKFNHDLTIQFGVLADACKDDNDYLLQVKKLIATWKGNLKFYSDNIFFDYPVPNVSSFERVLLEIEEQMDKVIEIPMDQREFEF
jgi:hypothetical protein